MTLQFFGEFALALLGFGLWAYLCRTATAGFRVSRAPRRAVPPMTDSPSHASAPNAGDFGHLSTDQVIFIHRRMRAAHRRTR